MPKRSNGFDKSKARAIAGGKKSSRKVPSGLKEARQVNSNTFESIVYKYMDSSIVELSKILKDPKTPALDMLVIKVLTEGIKKGDQGRLDFLLNRTIGKVADKIQAVNINVNKTLHDQLIDELENG